MLAVTHLLCAPKSATVSTHDSPTEADGAFLLAALATCKCALWRRFWTQADIPDPAADDVKLNASQR